MQISLAELKVLLDTAHDSLCIANRGSWPFRWSQEQRIALVNDIMQRMSQEVTVVTDTMIFTGER